MKPHGGSGGGGGGGYGSLDLRPSTYYAASSSSRDEDHDEEQRESLLPPSPSPSSNVGGVRGGRRRRRAMVMVMTVGPVVMSILLVLAVTIMYFDGGTKKGAARHHHNHHHQQKQQHQRMDLFSVNTRRQHQKGGGGDGGGSRLAAEGSGKEDEEVLVFEVENEYGKHTYMDSVYSWLNGYKLIEPYRNTTLRIITTTSTTTSTSTTDGDGGDGGDDDELIYTWLIYDSDSTLVSAPLYGQEVTTVIQQTGKYSIVVTATRESTKKTVAHTKELVYCKYVRREIRTLTDADREAFFDAAHTIWGVPTPLGQEVYGTDFLDMKYFIVYHLSQAAQVTCDHLHDGLGFFTQHMALTIRFEKAIQAVSPSSTVPYWDYTIDAENIYLNHDKQLSEWWLQSPVFTDEMMGKTDPTLHTVTTGRWAYTKVERNTDENGVHNAYGLLRSPWNTNKDPYVTRYTTFCGYDYKDKYLPFPTCAVHYNAVAGYETFESFMWAVAYTPHGPVHQLMGGTFGCEDAISKMLTLGLDEEFVEWTAQHTFLSHKNLYKANLLTCPTYCSEDTPQEDCMCTCPMFEGDAASGNYTLYIQKGIPIAKYADILSEYPTSVQVEYLRLLCNSGVMAGDQVEAASPNDISFWPIHPTVERLWQWKKIKGIFTDETWPDTGVSMYGDDCSGHRYDDVIELGDFLIPGQSLTNGELYEMLDPAKDSMPYVYDDFTWSHCLDKGIDFGQVDSGDLVATMTDDMSDGR